MQPAITAAARPGSGGTTGSRVRPSLAAGRQALVASITREAPGTDLPRFVDVLDALLAWAAARPGLTFRPDTGRGDVVRFELVGTKVVFCAVQVTRDIGPRLEIYPPTGRALTDEWRANVVRTLNAHSREVLLAGDRLRIGFGALKSVAARAAVLALMDELLIAGPRPTDAEVAAAERAAARAAELPDERAPQPPESGR